MIPSRLIAVAAILIPLGANAQAPGGPPPVPETLQGPSAPRFAGPHPRPHAAGPVRDHGDRFARPMPPFGPGPSVELRKGDVSVTLRCGPEGIEACANAAGMLFDKASAKQP